MEKYEIKLLVNRQHPLSGRETVSIKDMEGEKLYIESSEFNIHNLILSQCRLAGFKPDIVFETSGFSHCAIKWCSRCKSISVTVDFIF
ncbi:MAG: LysR substrate-binding domain-containing protein [Blautia sp.]